MAERQSALPDFLKLEDSMRRRHLNHQEYFLSATGCIISRGLWEDRADMRKALLSDPSLLDKVERVCANYVPDPYA